MTPSVISSALCSYLIFLPNLLSSSNNSNSSPPHRIITALPSPDSNSLLVPFDTRLRDYTSTSFCHLSSQHHLLNKHEHYHHLQKRLHHPQSENLLHFQISKLHNGFPWSCTSSQPWSPDPSTSLRRRTKWYVKLIHWISCR